MNKTNLIVASILAIIFTSILIISSPSSKKTPSSSTPSPISTESISPAPSADTPAIPRDWKTYSSNTYGISFSYPNDWRVEETANYLRVRQINPEGVHIISIDFKKTNFSIEELVNSFGKTDNVFKQINPNIKPEKIIINGIEGYKIEYTDATGLENISIIVGNNLHKILIEHRFPSDNTMNQILSTFKFIDPTTDWKTYENKEYSFSFQYPSQYKIYETMEFDGFEKMWGIEIIDPNQKVINPINGETYSGKVFSLLTLTSNFKEDTNPTLSSKKTVTIGNNKYLYYSPDAGMYPTYNYEIGKFFFFTDQENFHLVNSVFNQILSTFKFTP